MREYQKLITVQSDHLDFNDHVNNLVYMQWALDISREHWMSEITDEINKSYFWMVRSHHVAYRHQAFFGDIIHVKTFVSSYRGPFSERIVQMYRMKELLVEVKTQWCLIDRKTERLKRVPEEIQSLFK